MHARGNARACTRVRACAHACASGRVYKIIIVHIMLLLFLCVCVNAKKEFEHFRGRPIPRACAHVCARVDARVRARMHVHYAHTHTC